MSTHVGIEDSIHAEIEHMRAILLSDEQHDPVKFDAIHNNVVNQCVGPGRGKGMPDHDFAVGVVAMLTIALERGL